MACQRLKRKVAWQHRSLNRPGRQRAESQTLIPNALPDVPKVPEIVSGSAAFRPFIEVWVAGELAYSSFKGGKSDEVCHLHPPKRPLHLGAQAVWPSSYASSDSVGSTDVQQQLILHLRHCTSVQALVHVRLKSGKSSFHTLGVSAEAVIMPRWLPLRFQRNCSCQETS